ncbi:MAG: hypothetical protein ABW185_08955 [Sedimenticola sp.]
MARHRKIRNYSVSGTDLMVEAASRAAMKQPPWYKYPPRFEKALLQ